MKTLIITLLFSFIGFGQSNPNETLANFTNATDVNTALIKAQGAVTGSGSANQITYWTGTGTIGGLSTSAYPSLSELSYLKGATSSLQTQLNGKANTSHTHSIANITSLQSSLDSKQPTLLSGTNIKTINGQSLLGSGNITVASDTTGLWSKVNAIVQSLLVGETIIGTKATIDSMIIDFRKNNYLRLNK